uniref:WGS project CAEQ00000000 data, annotated contig 597 n=1 Tax=Trypanosoma congolense (strain IL3000) TaxID=1068625 RepID=F9WH58_TRYCI|nr:unnamed protein product [Trypanosoma congolense IL3000]
MWVVRDPVTLSAWIFISVTLAITVVGGDEEEDFYEILGLEKEREDASERDIKSSWRKLSKKHHPDLAGESQRVRYQRIQRAYEVLGDRRKRKIYDILGVEGLKKYERPDEGQRMNQGIFSTFFSFVGGSGGNDRGEDEEVTLLVPLEDMYNGAAHTVRMPRMKICRKCRGTGAKSKEDYQQCPYCRGSGRMVRRVQIVPGFVQQVEHVCDHCEGRGRVIKKVCPVCGGHRVVQGTSSISIDIEQGTPDKHKLTYELEADQKPNQVPGDIVFTITTLPHPRFVRVSSGKPDKPDGLATTVELTLREALLGFNKTLEHLDGRVLSLTETGITKHGAVRRYAGEGMPRHHVPSERGSLRVVYEVHLPTSLTEEQRRVIEQALG